MASETTISFYLEDANTRAKKEYELPFTSTISDIRVLASELTGVSAKQVSLVYRTRLLADDSVTLSDIDLEDATTIFVVLQAIVIADDDGKSSASSHGRRSSLLSAVRADVPQLSSVTSMDLCVLIQSTSSMGSWVAQLRSDISRVVAQIERDYRSQVCVAHTVFQHILHKIC